MSEHEPSFDQRSFVDELDDVAEVLKTAHPGHAGHEGWALRSTGVLTCGCGGALYAPEVASAVEVGLTEPDAEDSERQDSEPGAEGADGSGRVVVRPPREIDVATADAFSRDLSRAFATDPERVAVDFAGTTFCDSTALRVLVNAARQAHTSGCRLELLHPPRQLLLMAEILGASRLLGLPAPPPAPLPPPPS